MTKEEAIALYESKFWEGMTYKNVAAFQLFEPMLCIPFSIFHEALEKSLERSVWTHELGLNLEGIKREFLGESPMPTFEEILGLIPAEKRILVKV